MINLIMWQVVYVENGVIVEMGSYDQLVEDDSLFNQFIQTYLKQNEENNMNINSNMGNSAAEKESGKEIAVERSLSSKSNAQNAGTTEFVDKVQDKKRSM